MRILISILRWLVFVPIIVILFYLICLGQDWLFFKMGCFNWIFILIFSILGGYGIFLAVIGISFGLTVLSCYLVAEKKAASIFIGVFALLICLSSLYSHIFLFKYHLTTKIIICILIFGFWGGIALSSTVTGHEDPKPKTNKSKFRTDKFKNPIYISGIKGVKIGSQFECNDISYIVSDKYKNKVIAKTLDKDGHVINDAPDVNFLMVK